MIIDERKLQKAQELIEFEKYYMRNPAQFADYSIQNAQDETRFDTAELSRYLDLKQKYNSARLDYLANPSPENAQRFVCANANYSVYKAAHAFTYSCIGDYYDKKVGQNNASANLHMGF